MDSWAVNYNPNANSPSGNTPCSGCKYINTCDTVPGVPGGSYDDSNYGSPSGNTPCMGDIEEWIEYCSQVYENKSTSKKNIDEIRLKKLIRKTFKKLSKK